MKTSRIFTSDFGKKQEEKVLILPGWGGSHKTWANFAKEFSSHGYFVRILDLPGFGGSTPPDSVFSLKDYAEFVDDFIKKSDIKYDFIVAHSFGCRVLAKMLSTYKKKQFKGVAMLGAAGIKHPPSLKVRLSKTISKIGNFILSLPLLRSFKSLSRSFIYKILREKDYFEAKGIMKEVFKNIMEDTRPLLKDIKERVLIIFGKNDSYVPYTDGYIFENEIADSKLLIYEDGKHGLHLTHINKLCLDIDNFFKK